MKHLSTKRKKSTEIPKVVASEIGKLVERTEEALQKENQKEGEKAERKIVPYVKGNKKSLSKSVHEMWMEESRTAC